MPRAFSSGRRSVSTPVNARMSAVLPWSMWPAVPSTSPGLEAGSASASTGANDTPADVGLQGLGDRDGTVAALMDLEQGGGWVEMLLRSLCTGILTVFVFAAIDRFRGPGDRGRLG